MWAPVKEINEETFMINETGLRITIGSSMEDLPVKVYIWMDYKGFWSEESQPGWVDNNAEDILFDLYLLSCSNSTEKPFSTSKTLK